MSQRAEYTTGFACAIEGCTDSALHDLDMGAGYVHLCETHVREKLAELHPEGLPMSSGPHVEGIHRG